MKTGLIGALFVVLVLAGATSVASTQQSRPSRAQKAPSTEAKAEKKPNIVVFKVSGTPKPTQRPKPRKVPPGLRSLTNGERLEIAKGVQRIPTSVTPVVIVTLSPSHMSDPLGELILGAPAEDQNFGAPEAYYDLGMAFRSVEGFACENVEVTQREYVYMFFQAEAGNWYMVDFLVGLPTSLPVVDFQIAVFGADPSFHPVTSPEVPTAPYLAHLTTDPFLAPQSGWYAVRLALNPSSGNWGPWSFYYAEVVKYVTKM